MSDRGYKRSWKNLLLNKKYQLRFTLFMVGLAALLMGLLGWWVIRVAKEATTVTKAGILSSCRSVSSAPPTVATSPAALPPPAGPAAPAPAALAPAAGDPAPAAGDPAPAAGDPAPAAGDPAPAAGDPAPAAGDPPLDGPMPAGVGEPVGEPGADEVPDRPSRTVVITQSSMTIEPDRQAEACEARVVRDLAAADAHYRLIIWVMVLSGLALIVGLAFAGIKMTHRVAGPLHKVGLYLAKLERGHYDKVYDLRKGDQLVEFYEHFKHAHAGVVAMEREDVAQLKAALAAIEASPAASRPEVAAAVAALRETLARKEASLVG